MAAALPALAGGALPPAALRPILRQMGAQAAADRHLLRSMGEYGTVFESAPLTHGLALLAEAARRDLPAAQVRGRIAGALDRFQLAQGMEPQPVARALAQCQAALCTLLLGQPTAAQARLELAYSAAAAGLRRLQTPAPPGHGPASWLAEMAAALLDDFVLVILPFALWTAARRRAQRRQHAAAVTAFLVALEHFTARVQAAPRPPNLGG